MCRTRKAHLGRWLERSITILASGNRTSPNYPRSALIKPGRNLCSKDGSHASSADAASVHPPTTLTPYDISDTRHAAFLSDCQLCAVLLERLVPHRWPAFLY